MAYGVYSDRGYREHILEKNKNTNKTEVLTQEDQTFTGRKTFLSGVTTSDLEVQTVEVSENLKVKGKDITEIIDYLPNDVSKENKLTTEDFVNSSIATNTAYFRGTFDSVEALEAYEGEKTDNDYAFVRTVDEFGAISFNRYKYNSQSESWEYEYTLNNSSFTSAQWEAINSGITAELVAKIGDGSAIVPSITEAEYKEIPNKKDGQIREITDAPDRLVPFAALNDTLMTATNVLSALKINELFGYELGQNENGYYRKWNNGLLECWGRVEGTFNHETNYTYNLPISYIGNASVILTPNKLTDIGSNETMHGDVVDENILTIRHHRNGAVTYIGVISYFIIGFWK